MDPIIVFPIVSFMVIEGCCFVAAYNNVFRRLTALERRINLIDLNRTNPSVGAPLSTSLPANIQPSAPQIPVPTSLLQQQVQSYYYPPQMYQAARPQYQQGGDDPLPVTYAYYQNQK